MPPSEVLRPGAAAEEPPTEADDGIPLVQDEDAPVSVTLER